MFRHGHASHRHPTPNLFRDDGSVPAELFRALRSRTAPGGERRLAVAVLEDAVRCLNGNQEPWKIPARLFRWEAEWWFARRDRETLFSFENVCAILDLDAEEFRGRIRRRGAHHDQELRREA